LINNKYNIIITNLHSIKQLILLKLVNIFLHDLILHYLGLNLVMRPLVLVGIVGGLRRELVLGHHFP